MSPSIAWITTSSSVAASIGVTATTSDSSTVISAIGGRDGNGNRSNRSSKGRISKFRTKDYPTLSGGDATRSTRVYSSSSSSSSSSQRQSSSSTHSKRGQDAVVLLPSYLADARAVERYSPETAPNGALQLGVAENLMVEDLLVPALTQFSQGYNFAADCIYYQPTHGRLATRQAMGNYLQRLLQLNDSDDSSSATLDPEGIVLGAGCNAVLENLCVTLAEPGQGVMIPVPYYAAFEFDLVARAGLEVLPVNTFDYSSVAEDIPLVVDDPAGTVPIEAYYPTRTALEAAYQEALRNGTAPRILLISHPNNPLGVCYPPHVVQDCIDWCRERQVHLISDEIYAGSVYRSSTTTTTTNNKQDGDEDSSSSSNSNDDSSSFSSSTVLSSTGTSFTSALALAGGPGNLGPYVHLVYALSKDFALSGLRVGVCYSENKDIRVPLQKLNDLCQISSHTQVLVEKMMTTKEDGESTPSAFWTDSFSQKNHERLAARCDALQATLTDCAIPFLPADSGLFCWMDFTEFLPALAEDAIDPQTGKEVLSSMEARERSLYLDLVQNFGLLFTPGMSMRNERPGFFRCVFTAAKESEFELSLERIRTFANAKRSSV